LISDRVLSQVGRRLRRWDDFVMY